MVRMKKGLLLWLACVVGTVCCTDFGVSTSAYQVEGRHGRAENIWDVFSHTPYRIADGSDGDIACDHYHHWEQDLDYVGWLGAKAYRFSFSWTRLLPNGRPGPVSREGVAFYDNLINHAIAKNLTLLATLFHWDSPQSLQEAYGGWQDDRMIEDIVAFSDLCFQLFGDRIRYWMTLNEPLTFVNMGYGNGQHAPGLSVANPYEIAHRCIVAHARIYHLYHGKYAKEQHGSVSIALNSDFIMPANPDDPEDRSAAERGLLWRMGMYADPLFFGDYPREIRDRCGGRLPQFTEDVSGTLDFFALNHYTTLVARPWYNDQPNIFTDPETSESFPPGSIPTAAIWLHVFPQGISGMIHWLQDRYDFTGRGLDLVVAESGVATPPLLLEDDLRITYLDGYIREALQAQTDTGIQLSYYCIWSLLDNFEWAQGYLEGYGMISVDFHDPNRTRTPKKSAYWFRQQLEQNVW